MVEANETIDCKGLSCPMPILKLAKAMKKMKPGNVLELLGSDPGSKDDIPKWCKKTGNVFIEMVEDQGFNKYYIQKK